jgi:hypothetical protein
MFRSSQAAIVVVAALYIGIAIMNALTMRPWCDEGWFSNPAENLLTSGSMATTVLDPTAAWRDLNLRGIDRHTYWVMPLYILAQAGWYRLIGFSLVSMRLFSVLWGLLALLCWYSIVKHLSASAAVALLAAALLVIDFQFLVTAGNGRMDMMTFALESAALAVYLALRELTFTRAVIISQCLAAAGVFTHPLGLLGAAGLALVSIYYDRRRLRFQHLLLASVPYLVAAGAWTTYILKSPSDFTAQFFSNASGRLSLFAHPLAALQTQIVSRYFYPYGLGPDAKPASHLKAVILVIYAAAVLLAFGTRSIRRHPGFRVLLILTALNVIGLTLLDSFGIEWYLIYIIPFAIVLLAVSVNYLWGATHLSRTAIFLTLSVLVAIQLSVSGLRVIRNNRSDFEAAAAFLQARLSSYRLVMASAEFGIPLRFDKRLIDDFRLGYRSGKRPDLIVMDVQRYLSWLGGLRVKDAGNYSYIQTLLSGYHVIYNHGGYSMYERPHLSGVETSAVHP